MLFFPPLSHRSFLLISASLCFSHLSYAEDNQAPNSDFEQWTEAPENRPPQHIATSDRLIPTHHMVIVETSSSQPTSTVSQDSLIKHGGNYSVKLENSNGEDSVAVSTREIPIDPAQHYRVKVWVRGENIESASKDSGVFLWIHQGPKEEFWSNEASIRKPHRIPDAIGSFEWMPFEVDVTPRPQDNLMRIAVQIRKSTGSLRVDDVELLPVTTP